MLKVPQTNADGSLRYYTASELAQIDIKRRGITEQDHVSEHLGPDGAGCTRRFSCKWEERFAAACVFVGAAAKYAESGTGITKISRLLPDIYTGPSATFTKLTWYATKCHLMPYQFDGTIDTSEPGQAQPNFKRCDLEVDYELVPFDLFDDAEILTEMERYVTAPGHVPGGEIASDTQTITFPGGSLNYCTADGTTRPAKIPIPFNIGFPETLTKKKVTWRRIPKDIWGPDKPLTQMVKGNGTIRGYIGSLNETEIFGHPPLTLKLIGVEERLLPDPLGQGYSWDITYLFEEKAVPYGHLGLYFYETQTAGGVASGYYQVTHAHNSQTLTADVLAADDAIPLFHVREHKNLFIPGGA